MRAARKRTEMVTKTKTKKHKKLEGENKNEACTRDTKPKGGWFIGCLLLISIASVNAKLVSLPGVHLHKICGTNYLKMYQH